MLTQNFMIINRYCHWYIRNKMETFGLNRAEYPMLFFLNGRDAISQDCLGQFLLMDKATIAKAAAHLEEEGYLQRHVNEHNKREKLLGLTEQGSAFVSELQSAKALWENICLQGFSEEEKRLFQQFSERAAQNAVEYRKKGADNGNG